LYFKKETEFELNAVLNLAMHA